MHDFAVWTHFHFTDGIEWKIMYSFAYFPFVDYFYISRENLFYFFSIRCVCRLAFLLLLLELMKRKQFMQRTCNLAQWKVTCLLSSNRAIGFIIRCSKSLCNCFWKSKLFLHGFCSTITLLFLSRFFAFCYWCVCVWTSSFAVSSNAE